MEKRTDRFEERARAEQRLEAFWRIGVFFHFHTATPANSPQYRIKRCHEDTDIRDGDRYISPARHVRAFRVGGFLEEHERDDHFERGPGRTPAAFAVPRLASRHA